MVNKKLLWDTKDSSSISLHEPKHNDDNFRALLQYHAKSGDTNLVINLSISSGSRNMYPSLTIQYGINGICRDIKQNSIIPGCQIFFIIGKQDKRYISRKEQLVICVWYVDSKYITLCEDFLFCIWCFCLRYGYYFSV